MASSTPLIVQLRDEELSAALVGEKAASLALLAGNGFEIPASWALTTRFFRSWSASVCQSQHWSRLVDLVSNESDSSESSLADCCASLHEYVSALTFDDAQERALSELQNLSAEGSYVVRSSSPDEDRLDSSFAGMYESFLNVSRDFLQSNIKDCFCSCLSERVMTYRRQRKLELSGLQFAVLVQEQVRSDVSGVAFSINPLNNDFDEVVVNAVCGLGDRLVAGTVTPSRWVVNKQSASILSHDPGHPSIKQPSLEPEQTERLIRSVREIESLYAAPVDIEWTFVGDTLVLLQARPITSWIPLPDEMQTEPGERRILYFDTSLADGYTMSGPITPLSIDLFMHAIGLLFRGAVGRRGRLLTDVKNGMVGSSGSRIYFNCSNSLGLFKPPDRAADRRYTDVTMADLYETIDFRPYTPPRLRRFRRTLVLLRVLPRLIWGARTILLNIWRMIRKPERFLSLLPDAVQRLDKALRQVDERLPILQYVEATIYPLWDEIRDVLIPLFGMYYWGGIRKLDGSIDRSCPRQRELVDTVKSGGFDLVMEMNRQINQVVEGIRNCGVHDMDELARRIDESDQSLPFLSTWQKFMDQFGFRGPSEMDLSSPRFDESTTHMLKYLEPMVQSPASLDTASIEQQRSERRSKAFAELRELVSGKKKSQLEQAFGALKASEHVREVPKHLTVKLFSTLRKRLLKTANRWVEENRIDNADDIFQLRFEEISRGELNAAEDIREMVERSGAFYRKSKTLVRNFPHVIDSRGRVLRRTTKQSADAFTGTPMSGGVVRGKVKVMHDPYSKQVNLDEVLVACTTDPGWTPLFINASAILLEVGGELQHGALIAREYGKPCIAGLDGIVDRLSDGQLVEVDGDAGVVKFLTGTE